MCLSFQDIRIDLERSQPRVLSLRNTAEQMLVSSDSYVSKQTKEKLQSMSSRLESMLKTCHAHLARLEHKMGLQAGSSVSRTGTKGRKEGWNFMCGGVGIGSVIGGGKGCLVVGMP